jgi:hypothetical protein
VGAAGKYRVLDFSALDADAEPVRVRRVENENDEVSMLFLPFKANDHQTPELVPDLSAGTAGCAIPAASPARRPPPDTEAAASSRPRHRRPGT